MTSQICIASRILECLDDPEAAVYNCLLYLKELRDLLAVQAIFTVWRKKRFSSRLRARFNQVKRNDLVESIQAIPGSVAASHPTAHQHDDELFRLADNQHWQRDL